MLTLTIILALILMMLVVVGLSIGRLLTGKSRLRPGCGMTPGRKKNDKTPTCSTCGKKGECENDDERNLRN